MAFKFIHAADLHIDSPLLGLNKYDDAPVKLLRDATREASKKLFQLAISEKVDFIILAGDIFDGSWKDIKTGLFFSKQMAELQKYNIDVYLLRGNHDAENVMEKSLNFPTNVYIFDSKKPSVFIRESNKVVISGQSFPKKATYDNLSDNYPNRLDSYFNIGVLHTSLAGKSEHENYSPCSLEDLLNKNYDYWALGHIHKSEVICENPPIIYPGNIQGRHSKETGVKGCYLVNVDDIEDTTFKFISTSILTWERIEIDCSQLSDLSELLNLIQDKLGEITTKNVFTVCRIIITGKTSLHSEILKSKEIISAEIVDKSLLFAENLWIEKIKFHTKSLKNIIDMFEENPILGTVFNNLKSLDNLTESFENPLPSQVITLLQDNPLHLTSTDIIETLENELIILD